MFLIYTFEYAKSLTHSNLKNFDILQFEDINIIAITAYLLKDYNSFN